MKKTSKFTFIFMILYFGLYSRNVFARFDISEIVFGRWLSINTVVIVGGIITGIILSIKWYRNMRNKVKKELLNKKNDTPKQQKSNF